MNWFEVKNQSEDTAEIWIYDVIGEDIFGEGIRAKEFAQELSALKVKQIDVRINSPGGSVWDGHAIYNALVRHPATVTAYVDGRAASIASTIALAGDTVIMAENATMMIHNPTAICVGSAERMREAAEILDMIGGTIRDIYVAKTGKESDVISVAMDEETWFTAQEAVDYGLADEVGAGLQVAALAPETIARHEECLARYKNVPDAVPNPPLQPATQGLTTQTTTNQQPAGAADSSDGASQEEDSQPFDFELERIRLRK